MQFQNLLVRRNYHSNLITAVNIHVFGKNLFYKETLHNFTLKTINT